jgi:preprotein translocase subunit SecG
MTTIILVVHLLIAVALIGVVLLQRSEGGALGIGSGGAGSLFSSRGVANVLTRTTAILAVAFFVTSIALTMIARKEHAPTSVFDQVKPAQNGQSGQTGEGDSGVLPQLPPASQTPQVPVGQ